MLVPSWRCQVRLPSAPQVRQLTTSRDTPPPWSGRPEAPASRRPPDLPCRLRHSEKNGPGRSCRASRSTNDHQVPQPTGSVPANASAALTMPQTPFLDASRERLEVAEHNLPVIVLGHLRARAPRQLGPPAGLAEVAGESARAGHGLVGECEVEIGDTLALADVEHLLSMEEGRLRPSEHRVDPGALPFPAGAVDRLADHHPVVAGRMGRVNHLSAPCLAARFLLQQRPDPVEQDAGELLLGSRVESRPIVPLRHWLATPFLRSHGPARRLRCRPHSTILA